MKKNWMRGRLSYIGSIVYRPTTIFTFAHPDKKLEHHQRDGASRNFYFAFLLRSTVEGGFATRSGEISWSVVSAKRTTFQAEAPLSNQH